MARYMQTAAKANNAAKKIMELVSPHLTEADQVQVAMNIAKVMNLGVRSNPRPAQSTVRLNAVREAVKGLPVRVSIEEVTDEKTGYTFKALQVIGMYSDKETPPVVEVEEADAT